ncbi:hypothetical protein NHP190003_07670 [Helicobacter sp. NHP19-003]|uniref:Uncharacterized protein n=1 Tax=Helicobacter gastrocanis TaxID=2849641 RepID=A0ABM7SA82_9HELI|nr:hypothetical protein [Helicobacter sp. NHP19-003]BCZ17485.1 hypothetical protein NHP190003_07670 [Helicobacter sp. NHP19-003]
MDHQPENSQIDRSKILVEEVKNLEEIIKRMASNSLEIKKWTVALVAGVLALKVGRGASSLIALIPLCAFWYLDAFYLRLERIFRKKYEWLIQYRPKHDDRLFDMDIGEFNNQVDSCFQIAKSKSVLLFYGGIGVPLMLVALYDLQPYLAAFGAGVLGAWLVCYLCKSN